MNSVQESLLSKKQGITGGNPAALLRPLLYVTQPNGKYGSLQRIQTTVQSNFVVKIGLRRSVNPEAFQTMSGIRVVGGDHPAVTIPAKIFSREERKAADISPRSGSMNNPIHYPMCGKSLSAVFNRCNALFLQLRQHFFQTAHLPEKMHGKNGFCFMRDLLQYLIGTKVVSILLYIDKHRSSSHARNTTGRSKETEGCRYYFVPFAHAKSHQRQQQGIRTGGTTDSRIYFQVTLNITLKRLNFRPKNETLAVKNSLNRIRYFAAYPSIVAFQIKRLNR